PPHPRLRAADSASIPAAAPLRKTPNHKLVGASVGSNAEFPVARDFNPCPDVLRGLETRATKSAMIPCTMRASDCPIRSTIQLMVRCLPEGCRWQEASGSLGRRLSWGCGGEA